MKEVRFSKTFNKQFIKLPREIQDRWREKIKLFLVDRGHPSIRLKKLKGSDIWEISITMDYRATFEIVSDYIYFRKIGIHEILKNP